MAIVNKYRGPTEAYTYVYAFPSKNAVHAPHARNCNQNDQRMFTVCDLEVHAIRTLFEYSLLCMCGRYL